jgi:hypothetical protein
MGLGVWAKGRQGDKARGEAVKEEKEDEVKWECKSKPFYLRDWHAENLINDQIGKS